MRRSRRSGVSCNGSGEPSACTVRADGWSSALPARCPSSQDSHGAMLTCGRRSPGRGSRTMSVLSNSSISSHDSENGLDHAAFPYVAPIDHSSTWSRVACSRTPANASRTMRMSPVSHACANACRAGIQSTWYSGSGSFASNASWMLPSAMTVATHAAAREASHPYRRAIGPSPFFGSGRNVGGCGSGRIRSTGTCFHTASAHSTSTVGSSGCESMLMMNPRCGSP